MGTTVPLSYNGRMNMSQTIMMLPQPTSLGYYHPTESELHTHFVLIYSEILTEHPLCVRDSERVEGHKG